MMLFANIYRWRDDAHTTVRPILTLDDALPSVTEYLGG
jgi:hypothetical protein